MNRTKIEWVKNPVMKSPDLDPTQASSYDLGWTFNPITGCLNGCEYCYARKLANGRLKRIYLANSKVSLPLLQDSKGQFIAKEYLARALSDPFHPRFWPERLNDIKRPPYPFSAWDGNAYKTTPIEFLPINRHAKRKAKGIFPCDMSDLFGIGVPEEWTMHILEEIRVNSVDRFYLLTKQPQNLAKFSPFPDNCWVGVSVTNEHQAVEAVIPLMQIEAKVKFISHEPLLERIRWERLDGIVDWLIIGAQTKPYLPPKIEWVEEIVEAADRAGVAVFLKDNLIPIFVRDSKEAKIHTFQETFAWALNSESRLRQELPRC